MGQFSLFSGGDTPMEKVPIVVGDDEWEKMLKLGFEKEMLGLYISDHPLFGLEHALASRVTATMAALADRGDRDPVVVGGVVGAVTRRYTKDGKPMVFFQLEDLQGSVEVLAFPRTAEQYGPLVREDAILLVEGRVDNRGDEVKVVAQTISEPQLTANSVVRIEVKAAALSKDKVGELRRVLDNHPGKAEVLLHLAGDAGHKVIRLNQHRVEPRSDLFAEIREIFGPQAV
jgi:DNA polymerase-3 subunit alpha